MQSRGYSFTALLSVLKRHIAIILIVSVVFGIAGYAVSTFLIKPTYEAEAKMIVNTNKNDSTNVSNDEILLAQNLVSTYGIIICSRTVLNPLISDLNLPESYEELAEHISVSSLKGTQVMEIKVDYSDSDTAMKIAQQILDRAPDAIVEAVEAGSVKTIDSEYCSDKPIKPDKAQNTVIAFLLGLISAVSFVLLRYLFDDSLYKSEEDLQTDLGLTVLGVIPDLASCRESYRYQKQRYER